MSKRLLSSLFMFCVLACSKKIGDKAPHLFRSEIQPIVITHCAQSGCHDGSQKKLGNFTTHEGLMPFVKPGYPHLSELYRAISGLKPEMPPKGYAPLSSADIYAIRHWIERGAPCDTLNLTPCDTLNVSFSKHVFPILRTWCTGCHSGNAPAAGIGLSNYSEIYQAKQNSNFMGSLRHEPSYSAMPKNSPALSNCEMNILTSWLEKGAPND